MVNIMNFLSFPAENNSAEVPVSLLNTVTNFYYEDLSPILIGDIVQLQTIQKIQGKISYYKGALCVIFDNDEIKPILFFDVYIHENNIIKAFKKIN